MYYYDPNDRSSRRWAIVVTAIHSLLLICAFVFVRVDMRPQSLPENDVILVDFVEPKPQPKPEPTEGNPIHAPRRETAKPTEGTTTPTPQPDAGVEAKPKTRTPNPRALFNMNKSGRDEPENVGRKNIKQGEEQSGARGKGHRGFGSEGLDQDLQGRGLVGALPRPSYPGNRSGKVVVRVTVAADGRVTGAAFEQKGSTITDDKLIEAALEAARKARFTESEAALQSGTITYIFRME